MELKPVFEKLISNALAKNPEQPGDFTGKNGLLCCGVCGEPKRSRVFNLGQSYVVPVWCRCIRERKQAEENNARATEIERRRAETFSDPGMRRVTFRLDDSADTEASQTAKRYAANFDPEDNRWLLFHGGCGTGKSFLAACIANEVIDRGYTVKFTNMAEIEQRLWAAYDKSEVYASLKRCDLLIIDDLCAERQTEYMNEITFNVIDGRYRSGKPMIVTANLTAEQLIAPAELSQQRIFSRLCQYSKAVYMNGDDRRQQALLTRR